LNSLTNCRQCNSSNIESRSVRRYVTQYMSAKAMAKLCSYGLLLVGLMMVVVFGDEDSITIVSNKLLGFGFLFFGSLLLYFSNKSTSYRNKVQKNSCKDCGYTWEEIVKRKKVML